MAVLGLLLGSFMVPLATRVEQRQIGEARRILEDAHEALLGFAIANGRLPCPASSASSGLESPIGGGDCSNDHDGFLPAATLGLAPTDQDGFAIDPWGNRIRYAVTNANGSAFTKAKGISTQFLTAPPSPDLQVCSTGAGITGGSCASGAATTTMAAAVVFSTGPNGATASPSPDEAANQNGDRAFVNRPAGTHVTGGKFDDMLTWISPHILYNRLVAAGRLP